jgi:hypothetical protein
MTIHKERRHVHKPHDIVAFKLTAEQARQTIIALRQSANTAASLARQTTLAQAKQQMDYQRKVYTEVADTLARQFNFPEA